MGKIILTGDRPTGKLHVGHYVGSLRRRVELQNSGEFDKIYIMIADAQALTDNADNPEKVRQNIIEVALDYLSCGLDPEKSTIFIQSQIPELCELSFYYMNLVTVSRLQRNPTVKSEIQMRNFEASIPVGFFTYPISQAADITAFKATTVPVGEDQMPMIEQTQEIVHKFNTVYGEALVQPKIMLPENDSCRRLPGIDGKAKMSKSLGNGIDPLEVIDKYGADALRFFLATGNTPGNDMRYSDKRVEACANFANKLWNASRYVHMNIDDHDVKNELPKTLTTEDKWIVSTLNTVAKEVNENLEKFELGIAVQKIYEFIWDCYCDWYIELVKTRLSSDSEDAQNARQVLLYVLDQILRLLHPFMPYITEEIWQTIPHEGETVMLAKYPEYNAELDYPEASDEMKKIMDAIRAIRNRRAEMNVPPSRKAKVYVATKFADTFKDGTQFIQKLASASEVEVAESFEIEGAVNIVTADAKIYIPMDELVDREKELARLNKELEQVKKRLAQSEGKLNNQGFVAKAPEAVIEKVKGQAAKEREQIALIEAAIAALK